MENEKIAKIGDEVLCQGIGATIKEIFYQDYHRGNWSIEFIDDKGIHRFWKQKFDQGELWDGTTREKK